MTENNIDELVIVAKSWLKAPCIQTSKRVTNQGYDLSQRVHVLECGNTGSEIKLDISSNDDAPLLNPAFVITNWKNRDIELKLNGKKLKSGKDYRIGCRTRLEGKDPILWIKYKAEKPTQIIIRPLN